MEEKIRIPLINSVDFTDIEQITVAAKQLTEAASAAGLFLAHPTEPMLLNKVRSSARQWITLTESNLKVLSCSEALKAIGAYDLVYRIAFNRPTDFGIVNKYTLAAFDALLAGDKTVDEYILFRQISQGLNRRDPAYFGKPLQWHSLSLARWYAEFVNGQYALSDYDASQRAEILLHSDLWALDPTNGAAFKQLLHTAAIEVAPQFIQLA